MATRQVELQLKIQGAQTINELDAVLKDINKELKNTATGTAAFEELAAAAKEADGQLKTIRDDLRGISDEKQLDSVAKLGGAIAASFSVATVAATAFGSETEEEILKAIQVATQLNTVVNSFKPIIEGFNSANIRAFKTYASGLAETVLGFKASSAGAVLFGNATRAALTSTGIGIFVVALGTIVAHWDQIRDAIFKADDANQKYWEKQHKNIEIANKDLADQNQLITDQIELLKIRGGQEDQISQLSREQLRNEEELLKQTILRLGAEEQSIRNELVKAEIVAKVFQGQRFNNSALEEQQKKAAARIKEIREEYEKLSDRLDRIRQQYNVLNAQDERRAADEAKRAADEAKKDQDALDRLRQKAAEFVWAKDREIDGIVEREERELQAIGEAEAAERAAAEEEQKAFEERRARYQEMFQLMAEMNLLVIDRGETEEEQWERIKEKIGEVTPYVQEALNGIGQISTAIIESYNTQIEGITTQLDDIDSRFQESVANREALEDQLESAQGARRDALIESIDEERKKEQQLAKERKKLENERIKAQNRAAQIEWANSLINNVVNTALAVTKALPNIPLSIIVGALGLVSTGIIAANKPEPIPYDKGGYTLGVGPRDSSGYRVAGVVHENEYVIPERVLQTSRGSEMAAALEAMRLGMPSFAVGGYSEDALPTVTPDPNAYSLSAEAIKAAVESAVIYTVATEVRDSINTVNVIESRASA